MNYSSTWRSSKTDRFNRAISCLVLFPPHSDRSLRWRGREKKKKIFYLSIDLLIRTELLFRSLFFSSRWFPSGTDCWAFPFSLRILLFFSSKSVLIFCLSLSLSLFLEQCRPRTHTQHHLAYSPHPSSFGIFFPSQFSPLRARSHFFLLLLRSFFLTITCLITSV